VQTAGVAAGGGKYLQKVRLAGSVGENDWEFNKPLSSLGPVTDVDITIPPPPGDNTQKSGEATPEKKPSNPEGKVLAAKVTQALGGAAKLETVKATKSDFDLTQLDGPMKGTMHVESTIVFPDRMKVDLQMPEGNMSIVVTPNSGFASAEGMGSQDLPPSQKTETVSQLHRDLIYVAQHVNDPAFSFSATGSEKSGEIETKIVDVSGPGVEMRWFVDPQTGRIVRESYKTLGRSGPVDAETAFSDWKSVDGLTLPFHRDNKQDGQKSSTVQFISIQLTPAVDSKIFEKPSTSPQ